MQKGNEIKHFTILEKVGFGGMATVYNGFDSQKDELVAIKILSEQYSQESNFVKRFQKEAEILEKLVHPNIVGLIDRGFEKGMHYIVMEYVKGKAISDLISDDGIFEVDKACEIILQCCSALKFAHQQQVVHRDIKPHNIMINNESSVKILDFGIARIEGSESLTQTGAMIGTLNYVSPEQVKGKMIDHRSDIYSLGATFYEMITGTVPIQGSSQMEVVMAHMKGVIKPPSYYQRDIPPVIDLIIMKMLAKEPADRYQTFQFVIHDIEAFLKGTFTEEGFEKREAEEKELDIPLEDLDPVQRKVKMGQKFFKENKIYNAITEFKKAIEMDPENSSIVYELGVVYWQADMPEEAINCMEQVIKDDPDNKEAKIYIDKYYSRKAEKSDKSVPEFVIEQHAMTIDESLVRVNEYIEPSTTLIMTIIPGMGHFYVGRLIKGLIIFILFVSVFSGWYFKPQIEKTVKSRDFRNETVEYYFSDLSLAGFTIAKYSLSLPEGRAKAYNHLLILFTGIFSLVYLISFKNPLNIAKKSNLTGFIVEIKENDYVVINIGKDRGVTLDMLFRVIQNPLGIDSIRQDISDERQNGTCRVTDLYENRAIAKFR
jgi:serine/threonine protein kinase